MKLRIQYGGSDEDNEDKPQTEDREPVIMNAWASLSSTLNGAILFAFLAFCVYTCGQCGVR